MAATDHPLLELENLTAARDGTGPAPAPAARRPSSRSERTMVVIAGREYHWLQVAGVLCLALGAIAVIVGWFGVSGTEDVWRQMPYFVSGGIGGTCLISVGVLSLLAYEHRQDRAYVADLLRQQQELEFGLAGEFDALLQRFAALDERVNGGSRRRPLASERSGSQ